MSQKGGYSVLLEKKGRGRGLTLSRPWAVRTFKLIKQEFHYYDGKTLKGTINTAGSTTKSVPSKLADNKEYPFAIETFDGETVLLSASSDRIRYKCMDVLNRSAVNPDWDNPDDNERGAIQQRLRELEVEKLDTAKEEAAMAFGNAGAEASLQKARTAGNAQKGAMAKNAAGMFQKTAAKKRFREAMAKGDKFGMNEAAAEMMQACVRIRLARRKIEQQKLVKQQWLKEGYARRIQSCYRARLARRRANIIRWEKNMLGNRLAALCKMQAAFRVFVAMRRLAKRRLAYPDVVTVSVVDVVDFVQIKGANPAPLAMVTGIALDVPSNHPAVTQINYHLPLPVLQKVSKPTSFFKSPVTVYPTFEAPDCLASSMNRMDYVVVTIVDSNSSNKKDLLGQVWVRLALLKDIGLGKPVQVELPLMPLKLDIKDADGVSQATTSRNPMGTIKMMITRPLTSYNIAGYVWKKGTYMGAWNRRWFILVNGELSYYNSEFALDKAKASIACRSVAAVVEESVKGRDCLKVSCSGAAGATWWLSFDEDLSSAVRRKWLRVLRRACNLEEGK